MSLEPISKKLSSILNKEITFCKKTMNNITALDINKIKSSSILMLENIRFNRGEETNDIEFSKKLSSLGDIYVNDAFSCSHRSHSSVDGITKYIPSYYGLQITQEILALKKITSEIKRPITCIIGGSKISTKINIIKNLIHKFDSIVIVGGMANNILEYKGIEIGNSIREKNCNKIIEEIFNISQKANCKIIYPEDVVVGNDLNGSSKIKELNNILKDEMILDIGPKTIKKIKDIILNSNTILWNGPAGYFENINFANGSFEIAKEIAKETKNGNLYSVLGGGDTVSVINKIKLFNNFNFVSTAGGAFLEYLEGKDLPGISALN